MSRHAKFPRCSRTIPRFGSTHALARERTLALIIRQRADPSKSSTFRVFLQFAEDPPAPRQKSFFEHIRRVLRFRRTARNAAATSRLHQSPAREETFTALG
jgi:hypothetical protein